MEWLQAFVTAVGFSSIVYWQQRSLKALRGTITAQEGTIKTHTAALNAQSALQGDLRSYIDTLKAVLESVKGSKWMEEVAAYKEMSDEVKGLHMKRTEASYAEAADYLLDKGRSQLEKAGREVPAK